MVSVIVVKSLLLLFINTFLPLYIYTNVHYMLLSVNIAIHFHNSLSIHIKNLLLINILIAYYRLTLKVHSIHTSITYCLYSFAKFLSIYLTTSFHSVKFFGLSESMSKIMFLCGMRFHSKPNQSCN